jgi:hypothetical protein
LQEGRHPLPARRAQPGRLMPDDQLAQLPPGERLGRIRELRFPMGQWRTILPASIHEVDDLEGGVRRRVAPCVRGWEPACLVLFRTDRSAPPASTKTARRSTGNPSPPEERPGRATRTVRGPGARRSVSRICGRDTDTVLIAPAQFRRNDGSTAC